VSRGFPVVTHHATHDSSLFTHYSLLITHYSSPFTLGRSLITRK
jgi:hypothetical protein